MKPWKEFRFAELTKLDANTFTYPLPAFSHVRGIELSPMLVYLDQRSGMSGPCIVDKLTAEILASSVATGFALSRAGLLRLQELKEYIHPIHVEQRDGVWIVKDEDAEKFLTLDIAFSQLIKPDDEKWECIRRCNHLINDYVDNMQFTKSFLLCPLCEKRDSSHIMAHINRGEIDDWLIDDLTGLTVGTIPIGKHKTIIKDVCRYLTISSVLGIQLITGDSDYTLKQIIHNLKWRRH